jgi:AAA ATPase-like protein
MSEDSAQWVGRERSLQRLHHHLERALGGERQVVFVSGEAGIGKTTLIEMFLRGMSMPGLGVLWGRCIEHFGEGQGLLPLIEALERQCRSVGGVGLVAKLRHYAPTWLVQMPAVVTPSEREVLQREVLGGHQGAHVARVL